MSNITNIEEDIKIVENLKEETEEACACSLANGNERKDWQREALAIENILADRERLIKENENLKNVDLTTLYLEGKIDAKKAIKEARAIMSMIAY